MTRSSLRYASVCSGIECATVAWHSLGWEPAFFAEVEAFPSAVLEHHYPGVPNRGDFTAIGAEHGPVDLLVGGTPCQSFSVAGNRAGLDDPRGVLALEFLRLAGRLRARWLVWENVSAVLSSDEGRDFGTILGALGQLGYGFAWRVLDAQYFGVPQRRRRVFLVGHLGDWRRPASVLFERESCSGHPPPRREARAGAAAGSRERAAYGGNNGSGEIAVATTLTAHSSPRLDFDSDTFIVEGDSAASTPDLPRLRAGCGGWGTAVVGTLDASDGGADDNEARAGHLIPCAFNGRQDPDVSGDVTQPLDTDGHSDAVVFAENSRAEVRLEGGDGTVSGTGGKAGQGYAAIAGPSFVRRLTPVEAERLQGLPDDYTRIPWRGKPAEFCPDGPRYKAIGNGMAVPVMRWIGERIAAVDAMPAADVEAA